MMPWRRCDLFPNKSTYFLACTKSPPHPFLPLSTSFDLYDSTRRHLYRSWMVAQIIETKEIWQGAPQLDGESMHFQMYTVYVMWIIQTLFKAVYTVIRVAASIFVIILQSAPLCWNVCTCIYTLLYIKVLPTRECVQTTLVALAGLLWPVIV